MPPVTARRSASSRFRAFRDAVLDSYWTSAFSPYTLLSDVHQRDVELTHAGQIEESAQDDSLEFNFTTIADIVMERDRQVKPIRGTESSVALRDQLSNLYQQSKDYLDDTNQELELISLVQMCMPLRDTMSEWEEFRHKFWDYHLLSSIAVAISVYSEKFDASTREAQVHTLVRRLRLHKLGENSWKTLNDLIAKYKHESVVDRRVLLSQEVSAIQRHFSSRLKRSDLKSVGQPWIIELAYFILHVAHAASICAASIFMLAMIAGLLMQMFFCIMANNLNPTTWTSYVLFIIFPPLIVVFALLMHETYLVAVSTHYSPALCYCRAAFLTARGHIPVPEETSDLCEMDASSAVDMLFELKRDCKFIDYWFTWGIVWSVAFSLLWMLIYSLFDTGFKGECAHRVWSSTILGGMGWASVTILCSMVCDVSIHMRDLRDCKTSRFFFKVVTMALANDKIAPGTMEANFNGITYAWTEFLAMHRASGSDVLRSAEQSEEQPAVGTLAYLLQVEMNHFLHLRRSGGVTRWVLRFWLSRSFICWCCAVTMLTYVPALTRYGAVYILLGVLFTLVVARMSYILQSAVPTLHQRSAYYGFLAFFMFIGFIMCSGFAATVQPLAEEQGSVRQIAMEQALMQVRDEAARKENLWVSENPYPVCLMRWGSSQAPLTVLDMLALSRYSYMETSRIYDEVLRMSFGSIAIREYFDKATTFPKVVATRFPGHGRHRRDTVVVAVQGTADAADAYTDASFYSVICVLQVLNHVMPLLDLMPNTFIAWIVAFLRLPEISEEESRMFDHVADIVKHFNQTGVDVALTGHSLGGGIAAALGARLKIPTVVFSAPGGHFSRFRFGFTKEQSYRNVVNIVPDTDPFAKVDRNDATVQKIICQDKDGRARPVFECHLTSNTNCELYRACGDLRGRDYSKMCASRIEFKDRGAYVTHEEEYIGTEPLLTT